MSNTRKTILIMDDDPDIVLALTVLLEDAGYRVLASADSDYLNHLSGENLPDMILLDMLLSGADGRQLVRLLKGRQETSTIPVLMISAHPNAGQDAREAGADAFLAKPFELDDLLVKIASQLE